MSSQLRNLLRLVLTEEFIDDGLKENSKQRKRKAEKKDMRARIVPLIVRRKFRPRVKTCYPNFFLHKIIIEPSYMINELTRDISNFFSCVSFYSIYPSKSRTKNKHCARVLY